MRKRKREIEMVKLHYVKSYFKDNNKTYIEQFCDEDSKDYYLIYEVKRIEVVNENGNREEFTGEYEFDWD